MIKLHVLSHKASTIPCIHQELVDDHIGQNEQFLSAISRFPANKESLRQSFQPLETYSLRKIIPTICRLKHTLCMVWLIEKARNEIFRGRLTRYSKHIGKQQ